MTQKRSISHPFHRMGTSYNRYFDPDHFLGQDGFTDIWDQRNNTKPMEILQDFQLYINLPGFTENEIEVKLMDDHINVSATITEEGSKALKDEYLERELHMMSFNENFTIPKNLDFQNLKKKFDGITLRITIPYLPK